MSSFVGGFFQDGGMRSLLFVQRLLRVSHKSPLSRRWPVLSAVLRLGVGVAVSGRVEGASDEAAGTSLKNGREENLRERGEAVKSMCRVPRKVRYVLQSTRDQEVREFGRVCVGLGCVGLCLADRIRPRWRAQCKV